MLWLRGVPAHQAVLPECPDVPDSRDGVLRRLRDVVRVRLAGREDVSAGADILPVMPVGRVGLDAGSGATGVLANTRRDAAEPGATQRNGGG